ncbi:hypothetical protein [uncultured Paenibacillus sp.]|uniref:hypothetical protein n=1 Tax=uncultured Paenibacillus sp. TaxID=227322 RepID=UPI0015ADFD8C|nr:hypothetical protein [uncultured Paenibacillus sp.]
MNWLVFFETLAWVFGSLNAVVALGSGFALTETGIKRGPLALFLTSFSATAVCVAFIVGVAAQ